MKKLILLFLVLTGGILQANAQGTVKKRIFIKNTANWGSPCLYMWKSDNDAVKPLGAWPGTAMSGYNGAYDGWYFIDVDLDPSTNYGMIFNGSGKQSANITYASDTDKFFAVWGEDTDQYNVNDLIYYLYDTSDGGTQALTVNSNLELSFTIDNTVSSDQYYTIAPSFVKEWYFEDPKRWSLMIRPYSDYQPMTFRNISSDENFAKIYAGEGETGARAWAVTDVDAIFDVEVDLANWKYSVSPYFTRTISNNNTTDLSFATFSYPYAVTLPTGLKAYYAASAASDKVNMTKLADASEVAADEGLFFAAPAGSYEFTPATGAPTEIAGNLLVAGTAYGISEYADPYNYVFGKKNGQFGFFKVEGDALASTDLSGKAYLHTEAAFSRLSIVFDDETTDINGISIFDDNREAAANDGAIYDLSGRRVDNNYRGVVIKNGKKVVIR